MRPIRRRTLKRIHAVCEVLRRGKCPGGLCEHWIAYTGPTRTDGPDIAPLGRCCLVDEAGVSLCRRDPDRPAGVQGSVFGDDPRAAEPQRDWFGVGYELWSFRYFPSVAEYLDWHPDEDRWDRPAWRAKRYWRKLRGKQIEARKAARGAGAVRAS